MGSMGGLGGMGGSMGGLTGGLMGMLMGGSMMAGGMGGGGYQGQEPVLSSNYSCDLTVRRARGSRQAGWQAPLGSASLEQARLGV